MAPTDVFWCDRMGKLTDRNAHVWSFATKVADFDPTMTSTGKPQWIGEPIAGGLMPRVVFTPNLQRHVACPPCDLPGRTVREVLDAVFAQNKRARGYCLDEHGAVRRHMLVFVNGEMIRDREKLSDPVPPDGEVYVMQALSGG